MAVAELNEEAIQEHAQSVPYEIECPRCYNTMTLCSDFDALFYSCDECDFMLPSRELVPT